MSGCKGKSSWPELVGRYGKDAKTIIEKENPLVYAVIIDEDADIIADFRCDRVWIWVDDDNGTVIRIPQIG